jgi:formylglycine-generating enzyme required for sulfatase activity
LVVTDKPMELLAATPSSPNFWMDLPVVPETISDRAREIYQQGLLMGNDPHAFSKIGDCHSTLPYFLADFDLGPDVYQLGEYAYLQPTIEYFSGSFGRASLAAKKGLSTAGVLAPLWSDWKQCSNNESPLDCEIRRHRPSFAIISLGTNEAYEVKKDRSTFEGRLRRIIEHALDQGVVPILSTKADNDEGDHYINYVTARLAQEYELPLWNFWLAMQSLPRHGMRNSDHLTFAPLSSYADFSKPVYLDYGMQMRNLTALQMLDVIRREITGAAIAYASTPLASTELPSIATHQAGETVVSTADGMVLSFIPAGEFEMGTTSGNPDASPIHTVSLNGFWMDTTEITNQMYAQFLNSQGNQMEGGTNWLNVRKASGQIVEKDGSWRSQPGKENHPIVGVSWYGADTYCQWAGRRLPTEAEWEYAARGTDGRRFPWGNEGLSCNATNFHGCGKGTLAVGSLPKGSSPFGIFDLAGNVSEWVNDRYAGDYYQSSPSFNPTGPANGYYRVVRGGYWDSSYLQIISTRRDWAGADIHESGLGFRCALTP